LIFFKTNFVVGNFRLSVGKLKLPAVPRHFKPMTLLTNGWPPTEIWQIQLLAYFLEGRGCDLLWRTALHYISVS